MPLITPWTQLEKIYRRREYNTRSCHFFDLPISRRVCAHRAHDRSRRTIVFQLKTTKMREVYFREYKNKSWIHEISSRYKQISRGGKMNGSWWKYPLAPRPKKLQNKNYFRSPKTNHALDFRITYIPGCKALFLLCRFSFKISLNFLVLPRRT